MDSNTTNSPAKTVFIVSQPRAGSTLLQTMLSGHPKVVAPGETWLMLPLVHAISGATRKVDAPYDGYLAEHAVNLFAQSHLSGGIGDLQREIGEAAQRLFDNARKAADADVLIDKTPRYYWIIDDLLKLIPDCRVILLLRNPMSVLSSVFHTWSRSSVASLRPYRADLLEAPQRLANASLYCDPRIQTVHYEQLVTDPEAVLGQVQRDLGLEAVSGLSNYGTASKRTFGDPVGIHKHDQASQSSIEKWVRSASESAAVWRMMNDYRLLLGDDLIRRLGYDPTLIQDKLMDVRPRGTMIAPSIHAQINPRPMEPLQSIIRLRSLCAKAASRVGRAA